MKNNIGELSIRAAEQALEPTTGGKFRCPACGGDNLSLSESADGKVLAKCWSPRCEDGAAWAKLKDLVGGSGSNYRIDHADRAMRIEKAKDILNAARTHDLPPDAYLEGRGIEEVPGNAYLLPPKEARRLGLPIKNFPHVVLPIVNSAGEETGCQTIALTKDESGKVRLKDKTKPVKRSYGCVRSNFIAVGDASPDQPLLVAEGFETAATVAQITGLPAVATCGAEFFKTVNLPECAEAIVCADCGEAGVKAAEALAARLTVPTRIAALDGADGYDFNDALRDGVSIEELKTAILDAPFYEKDESTDTVIGELAKLSRADYEAVRVSKAKQLGFRATALDKIVEERRTADEEEEVADFLIPVVPWEDEVDGAELLQELSSTFERHIVMPKGAPLTCALWVLHAHAHDAASHSPILFISSPTKRCGKTNLLVVLKGLVPKPLSAANVTPATVFRAIAAWKPTMLIDEADTFISDKSELRGVLNSGHTRSEAYVIRCVGDDLVPMQFSTWAPKAFAKIGRLHPTLEDRSIPIGLKRKMKGEHAEKPPKDTITSFEELRRRCARWAADHLPELKAAAPNVPKSLNDRAQDNWEPLLAIAEACGDEWAASARKIAGRLSGEDDDQTHAIMLLQDLKDIFETERVDRLSSAEIVANLERREDRPWPEWYHGKSITPRGVARLLEPFKIKPRQVVVAGNRRKAQGYRLDQFKFAFKRYLPPIRNPKSSSDPMKAKKKQNVS